MIVARFTCVCGSTDIAAIKPGREPERSGLPLLDVLLDTGAPSVARCLACLTRAFPRLNKMEVAHV
jgi:hypothetical protein